MILVIADDISGAAEIAAIGRQYGLTTQVQTGLNTKAPVDLIALDTNTRCMTDQDARQTTIALAQQLKTKEFHWLYKKVDSVLRGHVGMELGILMKELGQQQAILVPANPSQGRTIAKGRYLINNLPLDQTEFAHDPEYPAQSCRVIDLLNVSRDCPVQVLTPDNYSGQEKGVVVAEVESMRALDLWAESVADRGLLAGGADFFRILLDRKISSTRFAAKDILQSTEGAMFFVCGSGSETSRRAVDKAADLGLSVCTLPKALYASKIYDDTTMIEAWVEDVLTAMSTYACAVAAIDPPTKKMNVALARDLRNHMSAMVQQVMKRIGVGELFIEGGATARAIIDRLQWKTFNVLGEYGPGIVQMEVEGYHKQIVTVKPGSYPWPEELFEKAARANEKKVAQ